MPVTILRYAPSIVALAIGLFAGGAYELSRKDSSSKASLQLEAMTKARELQTTLIALSLLEQGKVNDAEIFLGAHMKSSLVQLRAIKPALELSPEDMKKINESIDKSENYLRK